MSLISNFSYSPQRLTISSSLFTFLLLPSLVLSYIIWTELLNDTLQNLKFGRLKGPKE